MEVKQCTQTDIDDLQQRKIEPLCVMGQQYILPHFGKTIWHKGQRIACGGIQETHPGVGNAWILLSPEALFNVKSVIECVIEELREAMDIYHRIQCIVQDDFDQGKRFVEWLGFKMEAYLQKYTSDKKDVILYVMVN